MSFEHNEEMERELAAWDDLEGKHDPLIIAKVRTKLEAAVNKAEKDNTERAAQAVLSPQLKFNTQLQDMLHDRFLSLMEALNAEPTATGAITLTSPHVVHLLMGIRTQARVKPFQVSVVQRAIKVANLQEDMFRHNVTPASVVGNRIIADGSSDVIIKLSRAAHNAKERFVFPIDPERITYTPMPYSVRGIQRPLEISIKDANDKTALGPALFEPFRPDHESPTRANHAFLDEHIRADLSKPRRDDSVDKISSVILAINREVGILTFLNTFRSRLKTPLVVGELINELGDNW